MNCPKVSQSEHASSEDENLHATDAHHSSLCRGICGGLVNFDLTPDLHSSACHLPQRHQAEPVSRKESTWLIQIRAMILAMVFAYV